MIPVHTISMEIIQKLLNLNSSININVFKKTRFFDEEIENAYLLNENRMDDTFKIKSDILIILGWFSIFFYIYIAFYRLLYIYSCSLMIFISFTLCICRFYKKDRKSKLIIDHIQVFLIVLYLNLKALYIIFYLNDLKNDHDAEIIRTIIYNWVASTLLTIHKLDGRPLVHLTIALINSFSILIIHIYSINNHYYYLDAISSLTVAIGGYAFKKYSEMKIRMYYGEKIKNERMSNYFLGFINGLNGFYMNLKNDDTVSYGLKMKLEMESLNLHNNNFENEILDTGYNFCKNDNEQFIFNNTSSKSNISYNFLSSLKKYKPYFLNKEKNESVETNSNDSLLETIKKLKNNKIDYSINFINLGFYHIKSIDGHRYYEIYFRNIKLSETNIIYDFVFFQATDLIVSLINLECETQQKHQIFGKLIHEFKTPLNSILGIIDHIKEKEECEILIDKQDLNIIKNLSNYVIFLINDIIHYSGRKNYDELNIIIHEVEIQKIVVFSFEILNSLLSCNNSKNQSIKTELEFEENLYYLTINADETRLKQILLNLVSNAVKFTNSGFVIIKCFKHPYKDLLLISVVDSGSGIKDENQKNIFNEYFMEPEAYKNNPYGTGIGLSICKNLARRMNMDIKFSSKLGEGTEFTIEIPINTKSDIKSNSNNLSEKINTQLDNNKFEDTKFDELSIICSIKNYSNCLSSGCREEVRENDLCLLDNTDSFISNEEKYNKVNNDYPQKILNRKSILNEFKTCEPKYKIFSSNNLDFLNNVQKNPNYLNDTDINMINNNQINIKILIVDDDKYICNSIKILIKKIFKDENCLVDIITASDGVNIIQNIIEDQINGNKIKCIITDENMEYMNGSDAIKIIRNLEKDNKIKNVKIITATSQEDILIVNEIKNIGADLVMSKPLSKSALTKAFRDLKILI